MLLKCQHKQLKSPGKDSIDAFKGRVLFSIQGVPKSPKAFMQNNHLVIATLFTFCVLTSCESVEKQMQSTITVMRVDGTSPEPIKSDDKTPIYVGASNRLNWSQSIPEAKSLIPLSGKRRVWFEIREENGTEVKEIVYMINLGKNSSIYQSLNDPCQISLVVSKMNGCFFLHDQENPYSGYSVEMERPYKMRIHVSYFDKNDKFTIEKVSSYILITIKDSNTRQPNLEH